MRAFFKSLIPNRPSRKIDQKPKNTKPAESKNIYPDFAKIKQSNARLHSIKVSILFEST